jgi:hypothetical protein
LKGVFNELLPEEYNEILKEIASTGNVKHEWVLLKKIFAFKLIQVIAQVDRILMIEVN